MLDVSATSEPSAAQGLERALAVAGGTTALTRALGLTKSVVAQWRRAGGIPVGRVPDIARLTGLPHAVLRPDMFSPPASEAARPGFGESQAPLAPEARALGLNPEAIAAAALRQAIGDEKARRWAEENREAIEAHNRYIEEHGLPLDKYRLF